MTPELIGRLASQGNVKAVLLTHLTYRPDNDYTEVANEVKRYFSGQVLIAKDLTEF
jgi:ribonuclease BN (tRNA processing enzyme)